MPGEECKDTLTAYHEVGHALVGRIVGIDPIGVTIDGGGECIVGDDRSTRDLLVFVAGDVSESRFTGRRISHELDEEMTRITAKRICGTNDSEAAERLLGDAWQLDDKIIGEQWPTVKVLAARLAEQRTMQGQEIWGIIDKWVGKGTRRRYRELCIELRLAHRARV